MLRSVGVPLLLVVAKVSGEFFFRLIDADKNVYNEVNCGYYFGFPSPCNNGAFEEDAEFTFTYSYEKPVPLFLTNPSPRRALS